MRTYVQILEIGISGLQCYEKIEIGATIMNMRDAFGHALVELAKMRDDFVVLDADVAGGTGTYIFRNAFPHRFIQCGIAEQNMMSVAAGIASTGLIPIVTGYAIFLAMRAIEQARNSIAYPNFNVKIVASHLGLDVGPDGATHQSIEDIAIFRSIPGFRVVSPADPYELESALEVMLETEGPFYLRTGRSPIQYIYKAPPRFKLGKASILKDGNDLTIIAVGVMVKRAMDAANLLGDEGISCRVINMSSIKPIDESIIIESAQKTGRILTVEDHNIMGGLGSAVSDVVVKECPVPVRLHGINDRFGESGDPDELAEKYSLDANGIYKTAKSFLRTRG